MIAVEEEDWGVTGEGSVSIHRDMDILVNGGGGES